MLGIFIPLIVTNCCVIGRAEAFAFKHGVAKSAVDARAKRRLEAKPALAPREASA